MVSETTQLIFNVSFPLNTIKVTNFVIHALVRVDMNVYEPSYWYDSNLTMMGMTSGSVCIRTSTNMKIKLKNKMEPVNSKTIQLSVMS